MHYPNIGNIFVHKVLCG